MESCGSVNWKDGVQAEVGAEGAVTNCSIEGVIAEISFDRRRQEPHFAALDVARKRTDWRVQAPAIQSASQIWLFGVLQPARLFV
jgi:hypothetical protein